MGDHKGGAGRAGGRGAGRGGGASATQAARTSGTPRSVDAQLSLFYAGRLNDARNPGRQRVLATQTTQAGDNRAVAAREWVAGYRAGWKPSGSRPRANERALSPFNIGRQQAIQDRAGYRQRGSNRQMIDGGAR